MPKYIIERDIPNIGSFKADEFKAAATKSNAVIAEMNAEKKNIQWQHSHVTADKTFCVYIVDNEDLIYEHSERSGFPVTRIVRAVKLIDPSTSEG